MFAIEFCLKLSSMYSIRIPYSYQCARIYPLPAPSTIKGLSANALWQNEGGNPVEILQDIHNKCFGVTSKTEFPIVITSCTVSNLIWDSQIKKFKTNALLRQFAFTPYLQCMMIFKEDDKEITKIIAEALKKTPLYIGDSESLITVIPETVKLITDIQDVGEGEKIEINSTVKFNLIKDGWMNTKGAIFYMQDDPISSDAVLERYCAPLRQDAEIYYPVPSLSFSLAKKAYFVRGRYITAVFDKKTEEKPKERKKYVRDKA